MGVKRKKQEKTEKEKRVTKIALVGAANCGKTTLFNALTGARERTGNWSGVTVEKQIGEAHYRGYDFQFWDLPGISGLQPQAFDEEITCQALQEADIILHVMDSSRGKEGLRLTLDLLQNTEAVIIPVIHVIQKRDASQNNWEEGTYTEVISHTLLKQGSFYSVSGLGKDVWLSAKQGDGLNSLWEQLLQMVDVPKSKRNFHLSAKKEDDVLQEMQALLPAFLQGERKAKRSRRDALLLHPILGYFCWSGIMVLVFVLTFGLGGFFQDYVEMIVRNGIVLICGLLQLLGVGDVLVSLLQDGVLSGIGTVLSFFPNLCILFAAMSILEESGYMARMAVLGDGLCRKLGISGRALFPLMLGWGCTVPAIYATRILPTKEQRKRTMCLLPMFSCSAKLPIYVMLSEIFFPEYAVWITLGLYLLGGALALLAALLLKWIRPKENTILRVELPQWQRPTLQYTGQYVWERLHTYFIRVGSTVVLCSVFLWYLLHFNGQGMCVPEESFGAAWGKALAFVMQPIGLSRWQWCLALLCGAVSKELVVSSLGILYSGQGVPLAQALLAEGMSPLAAVSLLIFSLLYTPCFAAVSSVFQESKSLRFTLIFALFPLLLAYLLCFLVYQAGGILTALSIL